MTNKKIYIIGPVGSGKSTLAKVLTEKEIKGIFNKIISKDA